MDIIHMEFAPVTELNRGRAMNVIQRVKDRNCATYIMRNNNPEAVIISVDLFNETLITHYKYSLSKEKDEFKDNLFHGFNADTHFKYYIEDEKTGTMKAFIEIKTCDNKNYFIDAIIPPQYYDLAPMILSFAVKKIIKKNKNFKLYIKNRKYLQAGETFENYFKENRFELLQNNAILVRDFFKTVKEENKSFNSAVAFNGFEV